MQGKQWNPGLTDIGKKVDTLELDLVITVQLSHTSFIMVDRLTHG